jgi:hypothetical protein
MRSPHFTLKSLPIRSIQPCPEIVLVCDAGDRLEKGDWIEPCLIPRQPILRRREEAEGLPVPEAG